MGSWSAMAAAGVLVAVAMAGCLGGETGMAPERSFEASGGKVSDGYAYDGVGVAMAGASLSGWVNHEENTGEVLVSFDFAGSTWEVRHDAFSGAEEWKEGGVSFGLVEHGDTGVSTPIIPRIDGVVVTYGTAQVLRDGVPALDANGEAEPWQAHLMLSSSTIRGSDDRITKADGATPYDPAAPGDARVVPDDPQAFFQLTAPSGADAARAAEAVNGTAEVLGPDAVATVALGGGPGGMLTLNLTTSAGALPVQAGDVTARVVDATGNVLATATGEVAPGLSAEPVSVLAFSDVALNDTASLEVYGNGTYTLQVTGRIVYDDHPFLIVTWDDYALEDAPAGRDG